MLLLVLLALALAFFIILIELRVLSYAYRKIGVRPRYVFLILVLTLIGSHVNLPLYAVPASRLVAPPPNWRYERPFAMPHIAQAGRTIVAINVGGALIPALLSLYLFLTLGMPGRMLIPSGVAPILRRPRPMPSRRTRPMSSYRAVLSWVRARSSGHPPSAVGFLASRRLLA